MSLLHDCTSGITKKLSIFLIISIGVLPCAFARQVILLQLDDVDPIASQPDVSAIASALSDDVLDVPPDMTDDDGDGELATDDQADVVLPSKPDIDALANALNDDDLGAPPEPPTPPRRPRRHQQPLGPRLDGSLPPKPGSKGGGGVGGDGLSGEAVMKGMIAESKVKLTAPRRKLGRPHTTYYQDMVHSVYLCFFLVVPLYMLARVLERVVPNPEDRLRFDHWIDGAVACVGLVACYVWYGIVQEYIMTQEYYTGNFPSAAFLVLASTMCSVIFSALAIILTGDSMSSSAIKCAGLTSILVCLCSWFQETSLRYIGFPVLAAFKCAKIIPTMSVNTLINGERHRRDEYILAFLITVGVIAFSLATHTDNGGPRIGAVVGILLLIGMLCGDALCSTGQQKVFSTFPAFSCIQMVFVNGFISFLASATVVHFNFGFTVIINFVKQNPECMVHIIILGIVSTMAQYLIFYVVKHHGAVALAMIMSLRQMYSIVFASFLSGHGFRLHLSSMCLFMVVCATVMIRPLRILLLLRHHNLPFVKNYLIGDEEDVASRSACKQASAQVIKPPDSAAENDLGTAAVVN